jgi:hypothetical protein
VATSSNENNLSHRWPEHCWVKPRTFGAEIGGVAIVMSCMAGISLIAPGLGCRPGSVATWALSDMLTYSLLATLYLLYVGLAGGLTGKLLWPAIVLHAVLTLLLARAWFSVRCAASEQTTARDKGV